MILLFLSVGRMSRTLRLIMFSFFHFLKTYFCFLVILVIMHAALASCQRLTLWRQTLMQFWFRFYLFLSRICTQSLRAQHRSLVKRIGVLDLRCVLATCVVTSCEARLVCVQFDLVCGWQSLVQLASSLYMAGSLAGALVSGAFSDR